MFSRLPIKRLIFDLITNPFIFIRDIYYNFKILPFSLAKYLPMHISRNVKEICIKGRVKILNPKYKCILLGKGKSPGIQCFRGGINRG